MVICILLATKPTPWKLATVTCHMITSGYFFNSSFALRAITYITIWWCPAIELLINDGFTFSFTMPLETTFETDFVATFTSDFQFFGSFFTYEAVTIWAWTPSQIRIHIHVNVFFKLKILLIYPLWSKLSHIISSVFRLAYLIGAFNSSNLSIGNVVIQIVCDAIETKFVITCLKAVHIFLKIV